MILIFDFLITRPVATLYLEIPKKKNGIPKSMTDHRIMPKNALLEFGNFFGKSAKNGQKFRGIQQKYNSVLQSLVIN